MKAGRSFLSLLAVASTVGAAPDPLAQPVPLTLRPQDDFYGHVNAAWATSTPIPSNVPWISPYVINTLRVQDRIKQLIEAAAAGTSSAGTDAQRIGDLYRSYVGEAQIEAAGLAPLQTDLARIDAIRSTRELAEALGRLGKAHASADPNNRLPDVTPIGIAVRADARDATRAVLTLLPAGLGMPGRNYYVDQTPAATILRSAYQQHVADTLRLSGIVDHTIAARVVELESELARAQLSEEQLHDPDATYNPTTVVTLDRSYAGMPWQRFLDAAELGGSEDLVISEPAHLRVVANLVTRTPLETWRAYLRWQLLRRYAPFLSRAYRDADHRFYDQRLLGAQAARPRAELGGLLVEGAFSEPLGRLYVERYLDPGAKQDVTNMAEAIRGIFADRIRLADWLEPETKRAALDKLGKLLIKVAYPDTWEDFSDVVIRPDDLIGNLQRLSERAYRRRLARLNAPVDRRRWLASPQSTSAYYNRSTNELAIPAGYLQAPWYDVRASAADNYAGIGTVIGHEMGHAFDDQGARYDGDGNVRQWWTPADHARFNARIEGLVRQYDAYEALPGKRVNGRLTISENVGDLTGLTLAHAALLRVAPAQGVRADTRDRAFYTSFCVHWRAKYREPLLLRILASDGHPPQQYRCNGPLSNFEPFYRVYSVSQGDGMFRPKSDRVSIW